MDWRKRGALAAVVLILYGILAMAGERDAGDVRIERESLNACGASFSSAGEVELGWTIGQHGLHGWSFDETPGTLGLRGGLWAESQTRFSGTVFLFQ